MNRKRLAAMILTGCLLTTVGCSSSGSGLFSSSGSSTGCCGHGGLFSRFGRSSTPTAAAPVGGMYAGQGYGGADCPCSHSAGGAGVFHPAVMSQGVPGGAPVASDIVGGPTMAPSGQYAPIGQYPGQPVPMTTPGVPVNPMAPPPSGGQPPRIQPVPMAPMGVAPSAGTAPATQWAPQ